MKQYLDVLQYIKDYGVHIEDRTGVGTKKVFGVQMKFDLACGFPLITTKKMFLKAIIVELLRCIRGERNIKYLVDRGVNIRNERPFQHYLGANGLESKFPKYSTERKQEMKNFVEEIKKRDSDDPFVQKRGDLGPVYGFQWRNFNGQGIDQLRDVVNQIQNNPSSRRMIVTAWNPLQTQDMLLPPCHMFYQFNADVENKILHLQLYQRSADMFLGVPFNIASYATLLMLIAKISGYTPGVFTHVLGDAHIYSNHRDAVNEQLSRKPYPLPKLSVRKNIESLSDIESLERQDFVLNDYQHHERISAPVAV